MKKRVIIAAGGTGGHFYPGLVLAQTLRSRGWEPLILVRKDDPGLARLEAAGLPSAELDLKGLSRRASLGWGVFAWKLLKAVRLAGRMVKDFEPQVVVGMGGYLRFPAVFAARRRAIPCAVHESNSQLGLANRACVALGAKLLRGLPADTGILTGTPVRPALWKAGDTRTARLKLGLDAETPTLLVFGGSQGAKGLNELLPSIVRRMNGLQVLHLAGAKSADSVSQAYSGIRAKVLPFLDAMEDAYAAADLVVCRSGAATIAELVCLKKPAILVPFPHATGRHQDDNARILTEAGAARLVQEEAIGSRMAKELTDLMSSPERRAEMSRAYDKLGLPCGEEAVRRLTDAVERVLL